MDCILLGTGGMMPMPYRLLSSMALRLNGWIYLIDAGEGTQIGWKQARLGVRGIRLIAVTHLHADHCLGIPGLMMLKAQMENPGPLTVIGPPGIREFVEQNHRIMEFHVNYPGIFSRMVRRSHRSGLRRRTDTCPLAPVAAYPVLPRLQDRGTRTARPIRPAEGGKAEDSQRTALG